MMKFRKFLEHCEAAKHSFRIQSLVEFVFQEGALSLPMTDDPGYSSAKATRTMLGARARVASPEEMEAYLRKTRSKTVSSSEKFKMPYVHSQNIAIVGDSGQQLDLDALRNMIKKRPPKLLKQNEKIQHSGGGIVQFYNLGLPALKGLAVDEKTNDFVIIDTCPGAGACQVYCYARKGGYVMYKESSMSQTRILNFLVNDPNGFQSMLNKEIAAARKKSRGAYSVAVRWHDAGDFFSPDYWNIAKSVATANPEVTFYAYTKMGGIATGDKPANFILNFSGGAKPSEEAKVDFRKVKNSRVVAPKDFKDFVEREGGGKKGRLRYTDLAGLKSKIASMYGIDKDSIVSYQELQSIKQGTEPRWNVIVKPGDGDDSAYRVDVIGTYLLEH